ncbi:glycosyltransferase [Glutamicibacter protophormiae]|uniref:glycosyltransferase family protein n=1 Tax=Glutamicibacter protophormiae TaxID=37930 RepID=UPI002A831BC6|nr:glycosyltransferase [Glutamicibacter protophormiae]WPR66140.1 glycosyltransferase [Glutamicibacter protophormiae]WPR69637.1 glycosyltransferase [Glutamicibacter protophormiae]
MKIALKEARKALWHFRQGGSEQLKNWYTRRNYELRTGVQSNPLKTDVEKQLGIQFPSVEFDLSRISHEKLNVAVILDDFTAKAFSPEWNCTFITPNSWRDDLDAREFDMLFVESAWAGNKKSWQYHLTGPSAPRPEFAEMVQGFKKRSVPAVFWNKEDPPHFKDFLDTARLFDFVFTSDSRKIPEYHEALGHKNVSALSFAAQPLFHNPVRPVSQERRDVAFAGMYFADKYPERREQMEVVLGGAMDISSRLSTGLDIFSRQHGGDAKYQFPAPYDQRVVGSVDYDKMLTAYKYYNVFLNVNSVVDSPSMCARRIFEITAAGTPVVSAPSNAIENFFSSSEVIQVGNRKDAANAIRSLVRSPELRDRMVHLGQRRIWRHHTYAHRASEIAQSIGLSSQPDNPMAMTTTPKVSAVVSTIRPHQLNHIFEIVGSQKDVDVELILVTHKFIADPDEVADLAKASGVSNYRILQLGDESTLGDCLNAAVIEASGDFVTKMDDDDLYGEYYLFDQVAALRYSGASVVGKQAHYMYLADSDATLLRFAEREHRFTNLVMGPTMLGHAAVFKETPFGTRNRGEDTQFLKDVIDRGGTVYSADRFNFTQMRGGNGKAHTWDLSDAELTATGSIQWFGRNDKHVFF